MEDGVLLVCFNCVSIEHTYLMFSEKSYTLPSQHIPESHTSVVGACGYVVAVGMEPATLQGEGECC